ncbi:MAG: hypothetical protein F6K31_29965 [Symploca sp. SIO2G7]|nr:hypothetical protein [Symploca sp. SIO2G7]
MPRTNKYDWEKIEKMVLCQEEPLSLKQIAEKYKIPYDQVKRRASKHKWSERHKQFLDKVQQERERRQIEEMGVNFFKIDNAVGKITEALLLQVQQILKKAQTSEPMKTLELKQLTETVAKIQEINETKQGDIAIALKHLVMNNVIPTDIVPQVVDSLSQSEELLKNRLHKAFQGKIPD